MSAMERNRLIAARMSEIYVALRDGSAIAVSKFGKDAITLAALRMMKRANHVESIDRAVRLTRQGLSELGIDTKGQG